MNKLHTAKLLMAATLLVLLLFQVYWLKKVYKEEYENVKKTSNVIFRESMYKLQSSRFENDTMVFKGIPPDNLFMMDVVDRLRNVASDTGKKKTTMVISMNSSTESIEEMPHNIKKDSLKIFNTFLPGEGGKMITRYIKTNRTLNDSIPVKRIDSLYNIRLNNEGISISYHISKIRLDESDSSKTASFVTNKVPVGFLTPVAYRAEFGNATAYIIRKMSMQLLFSLLLIVLTASSFIFIYRSLKAQQRLTEIKNEFIGNITHELKTPISTVSVAIEAMKNFNALQSPERTQEYLDIANNELQRLSLLVDKVLKLSMFEKQQIELKYEWFDMKQLVEEVMNSMRLQFEKFRAKVEFHTAGDNFNIMADRLHITSVVYNLLDNALKYSKADPVIQISIESGENEIFFSVKDNGVGIPAEYRDRIFDKFFRIPSGDKHNVKGYGLGLSYVAHVVQLHKGRIQLESESGKGTSFIIQIPREHEQG